MNNDKESLVELALQVNTLKDARESLIKNQMNIFDSLISYLEHYIEYLGSEDREYDEKAYDENWLIGANTEIEKFESSMEEIEDIVYSIKKDINEPDVDIESMN